MKNQQGFTLIEASVAIAVVAILSGAIAPLILKNINDSKVARAKNDVQVIAGAVAAMYKDMGTRPNAKQGVTTATWISGPAGNTILPQTAAGTPVGGITAGSTGNAVGLTNTTLADLFANTAANGNAIFGATTYAGPYMAPNTCLTLDPWGRPYMVLGFNATGLANNSSISVVSAGPDGLVLASNVTASYGAPTVGASAWAATGVSADDIIAQVE